MPKERPEPKDHGNGRGGPGATGSEGTARYIADMTAELARLARTAQLGVLAYLLEMAAAEARGTSLEGRDPTSGPR